MIYAIASLAVGVLMVLLGVSWLAVVEGFAIFAVVYYLMRRPGSLGEPLFAFQCFASAALIAVLIHKRDFSESWQSLILIAVFAVAASMLGRLALGRTRNRDANSQ